MPRPKSLEQATIATAALTLIDRDGLDALSMRAVADELGTGTMSLYRYVSDREQLERWVVELIISRVDLELPKRAAWAKRATLLLERSRAAIAEHPGVVPLMLLHRHNVPGSFRWGEALLGVLTEAGFKGHKRVIAFRTLLSYVFGALQTEHLGPLSGPGTAALAQLSRTEYPLLAETAREAQRIGADSEFRQGLALLMRGLAQATGRGGEPES